MQQSMRSEQNTPTTNDDEPMNRPTTTTMTEEEALLSEIATLESRLATARSKLRRTQPTPTTTTTPTLSTYALSLPQTPAHMHALLLLSDSALPLGSFAFSSGLESYLAHHKPSPSSPSPSRKTIPNPKPKPDIQTFLSLSLFSVASSLLPYLLAAYRHPADLCQLDNDLDASTPCTVARRASVAQGRALLSVWERAFRPSSASTATATATSTSCQPPPSPPPPITTPTPPPSAEAETQATAQALATSTLTTFSLSLSLSHRHPSPSPLLKTPFPYPPSGHLPPLFSLISLSLSIPLPLTAYTFLLAHCKAVLSAGVRAGVLGPYQAQSILASGWLRARIEEALERNWNVHVQEAGQGVPVLDLWVGRHEVLYSRIFNS